MIFSIKLIQRKIFYWGTFAAIVLFSSIPSQSSTKEPLSNNVTTSAELLKTYEFFSKWQMSCDLDDTMQFIITIKAMASFTQSEAPSMAANSFAKFREMTQKILNKCVPKWNLDSRYDFFPYCLGNVSPKALQVEYPLHFFQNNLGLVMVEKGSDPKSGTTLYDFQFNTRDLDQKHQCLKDFKDTKLVLNAVSNEFECKRLEVLGFFNSMAKIAETIRVHPRTLAPSLKQIFLDAGERFVKQCHTQIGPIGHGLSPKHHHTCAANEFRDWEIGYSDLSYIDFWKSLSIDLEELSLDDKSVSDYQARNKAAIKSYHTHFSTLASCYDHSFDIKYLSSFLLNGKYELTSYSLIKNGTPFFTLKGAKLSEPLEYLNVQDPALTQKSDSKETAFAPASIFSHILIDSTHGMFKVNNQYVSPVVIKPIDETLYNSLNREKQNRAIYTNPISLTFALSATNQNATFRLDQNLLDQDNRGNSFCLEGPRGSSFARAMIPLQERYCFTKTN